MLCGFRVPEPCAGKNEIGFRVIPSTFMGWCPSSRGFSAHNVKNLWTNVKFIKKIIAKAVFRIANGQLPIRIAAKMQTIHILWPAPQLVKEIKGLNLHIFWLLKIRSKCFKLSYLWWCLFSYYWYLMYFYSIPVDLIIGWSLRKSNLLHFSPLDFTSYPVLENFNVIFLSLIFFRVSMKWRPPLR